MSVREQKVNPKIKAKYGNILCPFDILEKYLALNEKLFKVLQSLFSAQQGIICCVTVCQSLFPLWIEPRPNLQDAMKNYTMLVDGNANESLDKEWPTFISPSHNISDI